MNNGYGTWMCNNTKKEIIWVGAEQIYKISWYSIIGTS